MVQLVGLAVPYNELSKPFSGGIRERILPWAFSGSITPSADLLFVSHHDRKYIIGRTSSGTLKVREDEKGVWFSATPPDTTWAAGLINQIQRGDVSDVSFLFGPWEKNDDGYFFTKENGEKIINRKAGRLYEISIVTYGMYGGHVRIKEG